MIYLDNAATTRLRQEALEEMLPFLQDKYGNPSGMYELAREAHNALDAARETVRSALGAERTREIVFTSGGTESNNWALKGIMYANGEKGKHLITSKVEHHAVLEACETLERHGYEVTYLDVDEEGMVSPKAVRDAIRADTVLISIMWANNEVGTINPIMEIGRIAREAGVYFHTDAVQAAGHLDVNVVRDNVDLLSLSGHKFNGPKGVGVLYIKNGVKIERYMDGGAQERGRRSGTENMASIVGLARALELTVAEREQEALRLTMLRDELITKITAKIPTAVLNGAPFYRLPGNVHLSFPGIRSDVLLFHLDNNGIACSGGAACTAGTIGTSHVLEAMGFDKMRMSSSVRLSLGRYNTKEEIDKTVGILYEIYKNL